jgi:hypothetical protein
VTEILNGVERDRARVGSVFRAAVLDWATVWRLLLEEMLSVTELVVRVVRVAGVAVVGRRESDMVSV